MGESAAARPVRVHRNGPALRPCQSNGPGAQGGVTLTWGWGPRRRARGDGACGWDAASDHLRGLPCHAPSAIGFAGEDLAPHFGPQRAVCVLRCNPHHAIACAPGTTARSVRQTFGWRWRVRTGGHRPGPRCRSPARSGFPARKLASSRWMVLACSGRGKAVVSSGSSARPSSAALPSMGCAARGGAGRKVVGAYSKAVCSQSRPLA